MRIPIEILRAAKAAGCPAFRPGGRLDERGFRSWYRKHRVRLQTAAKSGAGLRDQKLSEEIRKLRIKNDRDEGRLVPRDAVLASVDRISSAADKILTQRLEIEWPTAVSCCDVPTARTLGKRVGDAIRDDLGALGHLWHE